MRTHSEFEYVVHYPEPPIDPTTILFTYQNLKVLVFVDVIAFLVDTLTTKLIFRPKTVISLRTQPDNSLSFPLYLKKTWGSLFIGFMFRRIGSWKPVTFILVEFNS